MKLYFSIFICLLIGFSTFNANGQHKYVSKGDGPAFDGYDLVSYFENKKPLQGKASFQTNYDGLLLYFATQENLSTFNKKPETYLPAYGGYCATAVSNKILIEPDYSNFQIQDGRLFFFEVRGFFNGRTAWNKDPQLNEILADKFYRGKFQESSDN
jgi:YHS domain-containing protein